MHKHTIPILVGVLLYCLGVYMYATLRYAGNWSENDTLRLTHSILEAQDMGTILNQDNPYVNGLTYQAVSIFIVKLSGVSLQTIQLYIYPFINMLLAVVVFVAYRALISNTAIALLGTLLLFTQPDFLFVTWRGSHEKITWSLAMAMLFLLTRSFRLKEGDSRRIPAYVLTFYILAFAFISSNAFFAFSFILAFAIAFVAAKGLFVLRRSAHGRIAVEDQLELQFQHLIYITISCGILLYLFFFHIYPPALHLLRALRHLMDAVATLFLQADHSVSANPYQYANTTWIIPGIFPILMTFSLGIMSISALTWLYGCWRFVRRAPLEQAIAPRLLLWLIYPVFVVQVILSLIADRTNSVGSNLQIRLFPPLMITTIPIFTYGVYHFVQWIKPGKVRGFVIGSTAMLMIPISTLSLFKVTNEPLLSNTWLFSTSTEQSAAEWTLHHSIEPVIWLGTDERLRIVMRFYAPQIEWDDFEFGPEVPANMRYYLTSEIGRAKSVRQGEPLPYMGEEHRIYDNGAVQVYYRRPRTIYQR